MKNFLVISVLSLFIFSCAANKNEIIELDEKNAYEMYAEAMDAFYKAEYFFSSKKFSEAETNFDKFEYAAKSALMSSYSLYAINFYSEALDNIERYLKTYRSDKNIIYGHYLKALIFYDQLSDEKRDINPTLKAKKHIDFFLITYPDSDYATDLRFKKDLILNQLAAKEIYVARFYIETKKWIPAINRLKKIVKEYDETIFIEEALHRLVEIYYHLGVEDEAKKYASILGYNYNTSEWFEQSYKLLNKNYKIKKKIKNDKEKGLIKSIFKKINLN
ncbi:outer membrane protein assembly factor BamD [Pelagibacteraceae bacterium]|jgi:outer membrane protein assembly factor BamD|nr:outer membrane protein assembly factor BamD [Pelagibacteraceae bacterium]